MSARPTYSDEFKADAVALVISSGRSPASVAPELGISVTALKRCVRLHNEGQSEGGGKPDDPVDPAKYKALGLFKVPGEWSAEMIAHAAIRAALLKRIRDL